jgi:hypothetical protein
MPKKLKLDLNGLKVNSFVTSLEKQEREKVKGGVEWTDFGSCSCDGACFSVDCYTNGQLTCESCNTEPECCGYSGTNCEVCTKTLSADTCRSVAC